MDNTGSNVGELFKQSQLFTFVLHVHTVFFFFQTCTFLLQGGIQLFYFPGALLILDMLFQRQKGTLESWEPLPTRIHEVAF